MKILVTAGGTNEPIDGVRRIANMSTGQTGTVLAGHFAAMGAEVLLLHAQDSLVPVAEAGAAGRIESRSFRSFADLAGKLEEILSTREFDAVVHLAAVSDYSVTRVLIDGRDFPPGGPGKIQDVEEVVVMLRKNPKLIDSIKNWSRGGNVTVVGFKLTDTPDRSVRRDQAMAQLRRGGTDLTVQNDVSDITPDAHPAMIYGNAGFIAGTETKHEMAEVLWHLLAEGVDK
ncbi:MAG: phosphopantothenoylcysteine decarboxylase [Spirochaetaceae bacterium]|nr:phosphopantothenoylcysteine decarboxylase [Spirochaetaceae bacterium]